MSHIYRDARGFIHFTRKDRVWELKHSLVLWWVLVPGMNWLPFLWAAVKGQRRRWLLPAAFYAGLLVAAVLSLEPQEAWVPAWVGPVWWLFWPVSWLHASNFRAFYLPRLEELEDRAPQDDQLFAARVRQEALRDAGLLAKEPPPIANDPLGSYFTQAEDRP